MFADRSMNIGYLGKYSKIGGDIVNELLRAPAAADRCDATQWVRGQVSILLD